LVTFGAPAPIFIDTSPKALISDAMKFKKIQLLLKKAQAERAQIVSELHKSSLDHTRARKDLAAARAALKAARKALKKQRLIAENSRGAFRRLRKQQRRNDQLVVKLLHKLARIEKKTRDKAAPRTKAKSRPQQAKRTLRAKSSRTARTTTRSPQEAFEVDFKPASLSES
jgi:hypothetical protein